MHINKKLTNIEVTIMSIPKKKSPAKLDPRTPIVDISPAITKATTGVLFLE